MTPPVQRILVPLDGSPLAELALAEALALSKLPETEVMLLQVVRPIEDVIVIGRQEITLDQQWDVQKDRAIRYLRGIAGRREWQGVNVHVAVEMGRPAETILAFAEKHGIDRIGCPATGEQVSAAGCLAASPTECCVRANTPVVLVRPPGSTSNA